VAAHAWLTDRGYGKPVQATEIIAEVTASAGPVMPFEVAAGSVETRTAWLRVHAPHLLGHGE